MVWGNKLSLSVLRREWGTMKGELGAPPTPADTTVRGQDPTPERLLCNPIPLCFVLFMRAVVTASFTQIQLAPFQPNSPSM